MQEYRLPKVLLNSKPIKKLNFLGDLLQDWKMNSTLEFGRIQNGLNLEEKEEKLITIRSK